MRPVHRPNSGLTCSRWPYGRVRAREEGCVRARCWVCPLCSAWLRYSHRFHSFRHTAQRPLLHTRSPAHSQPVFSSRPPNASATAWKIHARPPSIASAIPPSPGTRPLGPFTKHTLTPPSPPHPRLTWKSSGPSLPAHQPASPTRPRSRSSAASVYCSPARADCAFAGRARSRRVKV